MGHGFFSDISYKSYSNKISDKSSDEIFSRKMSEDMSPKGLVIRESRDSEDNPVSLPIIIGLDVTGSMGYIPEAIIKEDLGVIIGGLKKGGVSNPQILFTAIGDHISDRHPLQIGQFESTDQLLVKWLESTYLEKGGGGGATESYFLAWLLGGKHTSIDSLEKRNLKGFIFTIGDEANHPKIDNNSLREIFGDTIKQEEYTDKELLEMAKEKYNVFHIHANDGSYPNDKRVLGYWRDLLGQNLLIAETHKDIPNLIINAITSTLRSSDNVIDNTSTTDSEDTIIL